MSRLPCPYCLGVGRFKSGPCEECRGSGYVPRPENAILPQEELDRLERERQPRHLRADLERTTRVLPDDDANA